MLETITLFLELVAMTLVPYALCSLGIMIGGRTGVFNISGEGIMLMGASTGFLGAYFAGNSAVGLFLALIVGGCLGLLLAYLTETLKINQFIIGICLYIFGMGLADLLYKIIIGVQLTPPLVQSLPKILIPGLSQIPVLDALLNQNALVYLTYALTPVLYYVLYKTRLGLNTRAVGENPKVADVVGINVVRTRYACTMIGGMLMGLAGAYLPLVFTGTYMPLIAGGRGFMAIGLAIFGSWRPERIFAGSFLFAGIEVLAFRMQILKIAVPYQFLLMLPFIAVLILMGVFYKRAEFPAAIGSPYSRE